jgi:hypothetical protein
LEQAVLFLGFQKRNELSHKLAVMFNIHGFLEEVGIRHCHQTLHHTPASKCNGYSWNICKFSALHSYMAILATDIPTDRKPTLVCKVSIIQNDHITVSFETTDNIEVFFICQFPSVYALHTPVHYKNDISYFFAASCILPFSNPLF